ncbi:hypothetical protein ACFX13_030239 [Malus domestica]
MPKVDDLGKYLGITAIWGRSKRDTFAYVKDRVMTKISQAKTDGGIGLRNLKDFNIALLANQAEKGGRGLIGLGQSVKRQGPYSQGCKVRFWVDNWVPGILAAVSQVAHVVEFIDPVSQGWNLDQVSNLIPMKERNAIINIYTGVLQRPDKLMWHSVKNGDYSVKSRYLWLHNFHPSLRSGCPFTSWITDPLVWDWIWRCKAPLKIRSITILANWMFTISSNAQGNKAASSRRPQYHHGRQKVGAERGSVRIVTQDNASMCIAVRSLEVSASNAAISEALTVLEGCLLAKNLQFQDMVIESDALDIIRYVNSASLSRMRKDGMTFQACSWSWVPRLANMAVDFVVRNISPEMCGLGWVKRPPYSLVGILNKDDLPSPPS